METTLAIITERVDDLPLFFGHIDRMGLAPLVNDPGINSGTKLAVNDAELTLFSTKPIYFLAETYHWPVLRPVK